MRAVNRLQCVRCPSAVRHLFAARFRSPAPRRSAAPHLQPGKAAISPVPPPQSEIASYLRTSQIRISAAWSRPPRTQPAVIPTQRSRVQALLAACAIRVRALLGARAINQGIPHSFGSFSSSLFSSFSFVLFVLCFSLRRGLELPENAATAQFLRRARSPAPLEPTPRTPTLINRFELPL